MTASSIDLTTLTAVKNWLSSSGQAPANQSDDAAIQACITTFSSTFLWRVAQSPQDYTQPLLSHFVQPVSYTEVYDGNGSFRLFLRHRPIQSVFSLVIGSNTILASQSWGRNGYIIDANKVSISIRGNGGGDSVPFSFGNYLGSRGGFWEGLQNVFVTYSAGFGIGAIASSILGSGGAGYNVNDTFTVNTGMTLATGIVLTVSSGVVLTYQLNTLGVGYSNQELVGTTAVTGSGAGLALLLTVNGTPNDIELEARKSCALQYKKKDWIGLRSKSLAQGAGTTSYQDYYLEPSTERLISQYTNWAGGMS